MPGMGGGLNVWQMNWPGSDPWPPLRPAKMFRGMLRENELFWLKVSRSKGHKVFGRFLASAFAQVVQGP
jgi:hypothetical protein